MTNAENEDLEKILVALEHQSSINASQDRINIYLIKSIERMFIGLGVLTFTVLLLIGALLLVVS